ncbi:MAG: biotin--[acetyl-CoA-carboxylase] ligase [Paludibacteraceae bacterium]|nr:biotin--[acetyl-CoA-carboxylase] ligase [Paludibacteraceae bacterium]
MVEDGILFLNEVDSTNTYMRHLLDGEEESVQEGLMVCTEFQSQGRGQMDNTWESAKGENLLFSLLLYPTFIAPSDMFLISQAVSLGVKDMLNIYCGISGISIKWPNDIYWRDKKIAGILVENFISGHSIESSIVGIGININQKEFLSDAPNPVSVSQISGKEFNVNECAVVVRKAILDRYILLLNAKLDKIRDDFFASLYRREGLFKYRDAAGEFMAEIDDVLPHGILVLRDEDGRRREYAFKEVEFIL